MNIEEYEAIAIERVRSIMREKELKYRFSDFEENTINNRCWALKSGKGIAVSLPYHFERCGKELKAKRLEFLEYANVRVLDTSILFTFSFAELDIIAAGEGTEADGEDVEKAISKVQKLLALANGNNNSEHEAIAASLKAQRLMVKYNLHIEQINGEEKSEEIREVVADFKGRSVEAEELAVTIAEAYRCKLLILSASGKKDAVSFYGYVSDAVVARRVFVYLSSIANRLSNAAAKKARDERGEAEGVYRSFFRGFNSGVRKELMRNCQALMIVTPKEVDEAFEIMINEENIGVDNSKAKNQYFDANAFNEGEVEGKRATNAQYIGDGAGGK